MNNIIKENRKVPFILSRRFPRKERGINLLLIAAKRIIALSIVLSFEGVWAISSSGQGLFDLFVRHNDFISSSRAYMSELHPAMTYWPERKNRQFVSMEGYSETPIRRAEVVFMISLPFSLLLNIAATALVYQAATGNTNLPSSAWAFAGSSALLFSGAIAWHDHLMVSSENNSSRERRLEFRYNSLFTR